MTEFLKKLYEEGIEKFSQERVMREQEIARRIKQHRTLIVIGWLLLSVGPGMVILTLLFEKYLNSLVAIIFFFIILFIVVVNYRAVEKLKSSISELGPIGTKGR